MRRSVTEGEGLKWKNATLPSASKLWRMSEKKSWKSVVKRT